MSNEQEKSKRQRRFLEKETNVKRWNKKLRSNNWIDDTTPPDVANKNIKRHVNHGKLCSCWMCGNPRKYHNELTMQEIKFKLKEDDYEGI